jgi:hypothetical protein
MPWIRFLGSLKIWALSTVGGGGEEIKCPHATWNRARILKLLRTPGTDSTESIPCRYQFLMEMILGRGKEYTQRS